jgi:hypothetical protein
MNHEPPPLSGLDDEETGKRYSLMLAARLAAEPHVLLSWAEDTQHPQLRSAYLALMEQVKPRAARPAEALVQKHSELRAQAAQAVQQNTAEAARMRFEPSRIKWLLAGRRDRVAHQGLPDYEVDRETEQEETELLETLLHSVLRTMC